MPALPERHRWPEPSHFRQPAQRRAGVGSMHAPSARRGDPAQDHGVEMDMNREKAEQVAAHLAAGMLASGQYAMSEDTGGDAEFVASLYNAIVDKLVAARAGDAGG
ncbi:hypothetical protein [Lysobacter enzymogenes]|uniref:hypothetical protein n=1 Tax=Lysobacter enzymogenes TaxID=69 RepID=UPI00226476CF|nr:hypothetical protein [Lysobacter enzymogenes]UZW59100.1 hypothetical protein BV903_017535 [Lysobacter enzymogenes]